MRLEHNESFGNRVIPRVSVSLLALRGGNLFSGTRLRFAYGTGIKAPRFEESFGIGGFGIIPNPDLGRKRTALSNRNAAESARRKSLALGDVLQQSFSGSDRLHL